MDLSESDKYFCNHHPTLNLAGLELVNSEPLPIAANRNRAEPIQWRMAVSLIPAAMQGQKYISLTTFRKSGAAVATPVWFGEEDGKLYIMTRSIFGKYKRIRNHPQVRVAPSTIRGRVTGPESPAIARILPVEEHSRARQIINRKYWLARLPLLWSRTDAYIEIAFP
jgi:PPOX class probable F420-dependent enzyme